MTYISDFKSAPIDVFTTSTDSSLLTATGTTFITEDGRSLTLALNNSVALVSGVLTQNSPIVANHQNLTTVSYTAASTSTGRQASAVVTLGATLATANQYQGGFAVVNAGTGIGQTLKVASNTAGALSTNITVTFEDAPAVALDATSKICLIVAPYTGIVISPTTRTASPAGVTLYPIPANSYGYVVTSGLTACLSDASVAAVGLGISPSTTTAGCITVGAATTSRIGDAYQTSVSAEARTVRISL